MPLNKFIPLSPDPNITRDSDMGMAQFGHLNTIVDYLNTYVAADSLQLDGTGPLSATARYITDSAGNLSSLAISTTRVGIGTVTPLVPLDITGNTNLTGILSVGNYVNATGFGQRIRVIGQGDASVGIYRNQASASAAKLEFMKSRGTYDAPVVVNAGDLLGNVGYFGYNGTSYSSSAAISSGVLSTSATGVEADVRFILYNNTGGNFNTMRLTKEGVGIGNALDYIPSATLQVRGSGSTSATTSLLVQNSSGTTALQVTDDGNTSFTTASGATVRIGDSTTHIFRILNTYQRISIAPVSIGGSITLGAGSEAGTSYTANDNGHVFAYPNNKTTANTFTINREFYGNVLAGTKTMLNITTSNVTGLGNATTLRGIYFAPTITDWGSVIAFESTAGNVIFNGGNVGIGTSSPTARLQVQGSGSTSATTSLLVQNSAGTERLRVYDDGYIRIGNSSFYLHGAGGYGYSAPTGQAACITQTNAQINFQARTNATSGVMFQFSDNLDTGYVSDINGNTDVVRLFRGFKNPNSPWNYTDLKIDPTYQGVGLGVLVTGIYFNPTNSLTGSYTIRAFQSTIGGVYVNTSSVNASAVLQADSTTQGFLKPRLTTAQKNAIATPAAGLEVYDTDLNRPCFYSGSAWVTL